MLRRIAYRWRKRRIEAGEDQANLDARGLLLGCSSRLHDEATQSRSWVAIAAIRKLHNAIDYLEDCYRG